MFVRYFFPFLEQFFKLEVQSEGFGVDLVKGGQKIFAEIFVVFV